MEKMQTQVFLDDICDIYATAADGSQTKIFDGVPMAYRTVGSRRAFDAMQAGHTITRMIRIPDVGIDLNNCHITIRGRMFQIVQVQEIFDTCPKCLQLSLEQPNIRWAQEMG